MILEAAKSIMAASSALVRAANAAQRELIDQGKVSRTPLTSSDDGQWSEGLISAARLVAAATHSLVEAAQNLVQGVGTEEMLISSAKQVAASTAQLLIACKVKSDPNSETGRRLQSAGNAVIKSTDNLVRAAQQAIDMEEEHILKINTSMVDGMAQEINARSEVIKMEKQLEEARSKLVAIRQAKYRHKIATGSGFEEIVDSDGYSQYQPYTQGFQSISPTQQHYHIANRSNNVTPPSPSFHNASSSTQYYTMPSSSQETSPHHHGAGAAASSSSSSHLLTANTVPRPYQSYGDSIGSPVSPILNRGYHSSSASMSSFGGGGGGSSISHIPKPINPSTSSASSGLNGKPNLDSYVQDLNKSTYGRPIAGIAPMSTFKSSSNVVTSSGGDGDQKNGTNYEGFTSRFVFTHLIFVCLFLFFNISVVCLPKSLADTKRKPSILRTAKNINRPNHLARNLAN